MVRCINSPSTDIYFHLAAEEYLLKQGTEDVFMLWQAAPSVVIGKHQCLRREVDKDWAQRHGISIARRFTGGGAVYHDLGNVNFTFIETVSRLPRFVRYLERTLDFLTSLGLEAKGDERLGIYLDGLKISGSAQCVHKNRVLYHCTLLYDTDLRILNRVLNPVGNSEVGKEECVLTSGYAVPSVRSEVTNIHEYLPTMTIEDFKRIAFQHFSQLQSVDALSQSVSALSQSVSTLSPLVSAFRKEEMDAVNLLREEKYAAKEWICHR